MWLQGASKRWQMKATWSGSEVFPGPAPLRRYPASSQVRPRDRYLIIVFVWKTDSGVCVCVLQTVRCVCVEDRQRCACVFYRL